MLESFRSACVFSILSLVPKSPANGGISVITRILLTSIVFVEDTEPGLISFILFTCTSVEYRFVLNWFFFHLISGILYKCFFVKCQTVEVNFSQPVQPFVFFCFSQSLIF